MPRAFLSFQNEGKFGLVNFTTYYNE